MSSKEQGRGGLSIETLAIASVSSLAAAYFIHTFWQGGAILGAAVTPVIVAIVGESLRKPAEVVRARTGRTREQDAVEPPPVVTEREDRFGIWEDQKPKRRRRMHLGLALATGLIAFAIAAFVVTGAELVFGGASDTDRFRVLPGKQEKKDSRDGDDRDGAPATQPEEQETVPEEEQPPPAETVPPEEDVPPETTPEEAPPEVPPTTEPVPTTPVP